MGLSQALFSGVTGIDVHQTKLNVIGNNIANVNTIGFKAGRVTFEDQISQTLRSSARPSTQSGGQNASQVGLGVELGAVDTVQAQGNLQTTGKPTDLALQGNGFFLVSSGNQTFFTRDGSFDLDSDGVLVNPANGLKLLGYLAGKDGKIDTSQQVSSDSVLKVPVGSLTSVKQTTTSTFQGNLNASAALQSTRASISGQLDTSLSPGTLTQSVYDALGNAHSLQVTFASQQHFNPPATGPNPPANATQQWTVNMSVDGGATTTQTLYYIAGTTNKFVFADGAGNSLGNTLTVNGIGTSGAPNFPILVDFSGLQASSNLTTQSNGQAGPPIQQSTLLTIQGNLNLDGTSPVVRTQTVYDSSGAAYQIATTFRNPTYTPTGGSVPSGATESWDVQVVVTPPAGPAFTAYNSAGGNGSPAYYVPGTGFIFSNSTGASLGNALTLSAATLQTGNTNIGRQVGTNFPLTIDLSGITTTKTVNTGDGQAGPSPIWNTSLRVFDNLGVAHQLNFQFSRVLLGAGAPSGATARWEWTATEGGRPVTSSASAGNSPLFFDGNGKLINSNTQKIQVTPQTGTSPFAVTVDFSTLTQLSGDSSVAATTQDGFPVGTLQTFSVDPSGLITGIFSNGQSRALGQIAIASFSNPAGLEKEGQNLYRDSSNSGLAQIGLPNLSGRGKISTGFVEQSNVDLSTEFTDLIITQRGFQANTRIITTVDELLQDVINLKR